MTSKPFNVAEAVFIDLKETERRLDQRLQLAVIGLKSLGF